MGEFWPEAEREEAAVDVVGVLLKEEEEEERPPRCNIILLLLLSPPRFNEASRLYDEKKGNIREHIYKSRKKREYLYKNQRYRSAPFCFPRTKRDAAVGPDK